MATQGKVLAKNRTQVIQQAIIDGTLWALSPDKQPAFIEYRGKTTDNVATELYIGGKGPAAMQGTTYYNRLYLPESTLVTGTAWYLSYNATDDAFQMANSYFAIQNLNGTTAAAFDINKSGAGNDLEVFLDFDATAGDLDMAQPGSITYAISADDTTDFLKVSVTGISAKTIYHKVILNIFSINETECLGGFFFGDTAAQSTGN